MAQAGRCYEDNPANYAKFLGLYDMICQGFNLNYFDCEERCPFGPDSDDAKILGERNYTVFGDSKCQYIVSDPNARTMNYYMHTESDDLVVYHSYN